MSMPLKFMAICSFFSPFNFGSFPGDSRSGRREDLHFWGSRDGAVFRGIRSDNAWLFSMGDDEDVVDVVGWEFSGSIHEFRHDS